MGWFWGSSDDKSSNSISTKSEDPLRDLDPSLRDFLKRESPVKYEPSSQSTPPAPQEPAPQPAAQPEEDEEPKLPQQSLFQDGRYAHLWKTYRPLAEIEAEGKTDQQKILDVLEAYNYRRAEIGRVALESCTMEQLAVSDCFRAGGWSAKTTMCRAENRKFDRCYMMQAKFLKALGYLSVIDRPPEVNEQIQMHADKLYHQMLEQEKAIQDAKAEGKPIPSFPPLLSAARPQVPEHDRPEARDIGISVLGEKAQKPLKKKLDSLTGIERELEETAIKAELKAAANAALRLDDINQQQAEERKQRVEEGRETFADKVWALWNKK